MRIRFRYTKLGKVRFTSHRDVARLFERALRRARLPVASTEGFSPRPKMHFGLALPTGGESLGEYLDIDFRDLPTGAPAGADQSTAADGGAGAPAGALDLLEPVDLATVGDVLTPLLPVGLDIVNVAVIDRSAPSLQESVVACSWRLELDGASREQLAGGVDQLLGADALPVERERKGKVVVDDIRPNISELAVGPGGELLAELATQPRGVRPSELVAALAAATGRPLEERRVCRTHQWIVLDGARREPLPPGATRAPHAEARAS